MSIVANRDAFKHQKLTFTPVSEVASSSFDFGHETSDMSTVANEGASQETKTEWQTV